MKREASADKLLLLGIDGFDPRLANKYLERGVMPNLEKYLERGAAREDLVMLGGHPTVTPPMWTTLATGCYANVHGITGFHSCSKNTLAGIGYNLDSRLCKAEQLWNCFAEAGKKTLVWHWPGASWPPTSDSPNLMVVDGTSPANVNMAVAQVDGEFLVGASEDIVNVTFKRGAVNEAQAACVIEDLGDKIGTGDDFTRVQNLTDDIIFFVDRESKQTIRFSDNPLDIAQSPIKPATGWINAPKDAKEFTLLLSSGYVRRPALILKNENGIYDKVAIYKNKKSEEPMAVCKLGELVTDVIDEAVRGDVKFEKVNRNYKLLRMDSDAKTLLMHISPGNDITNDSVWHPKRLYKEVIENVGYPAPTSMIGCQDEMLIQECMLANWDHISEWTAKSILHLIKSENLDVVFSHFHNVDLQGHMFVRRMAEKPDNCNSVEIVDKWMQDLYIQTDDYIGKYLHLLDEGWTILIFSDHGLTSSKYDMPMLIDAGGVATPVMEELGYLTPIRDEKGEVIDIDWSKTKAIIQREGHLYINLKGRDPHGIVDPADKYELEEQIMTDLYSLKSPESGYRMVSVALRNKDAVLLGQGGPNAGDICIWLSEGYNFDHEDCLSTTWGENGTSVSPIFLAAGKGIKKGFKTDRIIREIDFAPTVAVLGGVRMPAQCEGAPVYQILEEEY